MVVDISFWPWVKGLLVVMPDLEALSIVLCLREEYGALDVGDGY